MPILSKTFLDEARRIANLADKKNTFVNFYFLYKKSLSIAKKKSKKMSQDHEILALGLILANLKHDEARFSKF